MVELKVGDYVTATWVQYLTIGQVIRVGGYDPSIPSSVPTLYKNRKVAEVKWLVPPKYWGWRTVQYKQQQRPLTKLCYNNQGDGLKVLSEEEVTLLLLTADVPGDSQ